MYRHPGESTAENRVFYQQKYAEGFTTDCPSDSERERLIATKFRGGEKDYLPYIKVLEALNVPVGARIIDFGCSWGYGPWQFQDAGYKVQAYEISKPRCQYASTKLGVNAVTDETMLQGGVDVFFSAHVLEHVPSINHVVTLGFQLLRPGGHFIAFTPNGSKEYRDSNPDSFKRLWGNYHPSLLNDEFYRHRFAGRGLFIGTSPPDLEAIRKWRPDQIVTTSLAGVEMFAVTTA